MIDKLDDMFEKQKSLQKKISGDILPSKMFPSKIPVQITAIIAELGEILELNEHWKTWKKNPKKYVENDLILEVADLWHFVINLTLYLGISVKMLYTAFCIKNRINKQRQDSGY